MVLLKQGRCTAVATEDARLVRILRAAGIPFLLPSLLLFSLYRWGLIDRIEGLKALNRLSPFISEKEYSVTRLLMEEKR